MPPSRIPRWSGATLAACALVLAAGQVAAQILPWEVVVAEVESGRLRHLGQRLSRLNLLYQLHLGEVRKSDLVDVVADVDRILEVLEEGSPSRSIPAAWTPELRRSLRQVDALWGGLRRIALADPYEMLRLGRQFLQKESTRGDPLLISYFDDSTVEFVAASEKLLELYHAECVKTGLTICATARTSGLSPMLAERATKEAIYIVAGIDLRENRTRLQATIDAYEKQMHANDASPFFAEALDPGRGPSAKAARELLASLRGDWSVMRREFRILGAGDESNFDLKRLLDAQSRIGGKIERLAAALLRYASLTYGS